MRVKTDIPLSLLFIKNTLGIKANNGDENILINAISTDTRELFANELFIPLAGESFDGENFVSHALARGAYALSERSVAVGAIRVNSALDSLLSICRAYKKLLNPKYTVAITGSVGKTTTKELTAGILEKNFKVHKTFKNYNNEIGVPLSVLSAKKDTEVLVLEAGMNHKGELAKISFAADADISVITNIGTAHIGNFGSREKIAEAKKEILCAMKKPYAIIPCGEPLLSDIESFKTVSTVNASADIYVHDIRTADRGLIFSCKRGDMLINDIYIPSRSAHIPDCISFALAVCFDMGMSADEIKNALRNMEIGGTLKVVRIGDFTVIDDSYNSSAEAVRCSLKNLQTYGTGRLSAVLGDMLELGEQSCLLHRRIGEYAAYAGLSSLYLFGEFAEHIRFGAIKAGMPCERIFINTDISRPEITAEQILSCSKKGETLLVKGSRGLCMERIIKLLKEGQNDR